MSFVPSPFRSKAVAQFSRFAATPAALAPLALLYASRLMLRSADRPMSSAGSSPPLTVTSPSFSANHRLRSSTSAGFKVASASLPVTVRLAMPLI